MHDTVDCTRQETWARVCEDAEQVWNWRHVAGKDAERIIWQCCCFTWLVQYIWWSVKSVFESRQTWVNSKTLGVRFQFISGHCIRDDLSSTRCERHPTRRTWSWMKYSGGRVAQKTNQCLKHHHWNKWRSIALLCATLMKGNVSEAKVVWKDSCV